jgi:RNA polymerase sigma-70 factor (ECF subfamily)
MLERANTLPIPQTSTAITGIEIALVTDTGDPNVGMGDANDTSADDLNNLRRSLDGESKPLFEAAFRAHYDILIRYLRSRVGSDAEARDIAQEAYLRLMRYREHQDPTSLKALVFRIATNLVIMRARALRARPEHEPLEAALEVPANDPSLERQLFTEQQLARLTEIIQRLPPKCQQAFVLSRFHNMGYQEIADRLRISVKMVEKHIAHALSVCRQVGYERL